MNPDLQLARQLLDEQQLTLAIVNGDQHWTSQQHGIAALLDLVEAADVDLSGASAADLVVGKAAALLYARAGIRSLWARLLSDSAVEVLAAHDIDYSCQESTDYIRNRAGDGRCPMETVAQGISDPSVAPAALRRRIAELRATPC